MTFARYVFLAVILGLAGTANALPVKRCINLSNYLEVKPGEEWRYDFKPEHIQRMADVGFDTIRIPARVSSYWKSGEIEPDFAAELLEIVDLAQAAGLYAIVDVHHFDELVADPAGYAEMFVDIWGGMSALFEGRSGIAFELLNEPHDALTTEFLLPYYERAYRAIRERHPEAYILVGTDNWGGPDGLKELPRSNDPRVIHTFHYYSPFEFTHQQADWLESPMPATRWGSTNERGRIYADIRKAANHHTPTFLGEFGVYEKAKPVDRALWLKTVREVAEARGIGWCHWGFGAGFGLFDTATDAWDRELLDALGLKNR